MPIRYDSKRTWPILLQIHGSVWCDVLPYCLLNCGITLAAYYLQRLDQAHHIKVSPQGHALLSLLISYLVVSKVYTSLDRYVRARCSVSKTLLALRILHQHVLCFGTIEAISASPDTNKGVETSGEKEEDPSYFLEQWKRENENKACYLAHSNEPETDDDPLLYVQLLRTHFYSPKPALHLLERVKLLDHLNDYVANYNDVLTMVSTPLPFAMVQMGRTFLLLWTFTMPFALVGVVDEIVSVLIFVIFLTYGFVGLEFVSMQLQLPFDDGPHDIDAAGMGKATLTGIERDADQYKRATMEGKTPSLRYKAMMASKEHQGQSGGSMSIADVPSNYAAGYYHGMPSSTFH